MTDQHTIYQYALKFCNDEPKLAKCLDVSYTQHLDYSYTIIKLKNPDLNYGEEFKLNECEFLDCKSYEQFKNDMYWHLNSWFAEIIQYMPFEIIKNEFEFRNLGK